MRFVVFSTLLANKGTNALAIGKKLFSTLPRIRDALSNKDLAPPSSTLGVPDIFRYRLEAAFLPQETWSGSGEFMNLEDRTYHRHLRRRFERELRLVKKVNFIICSLLGASLLFPHVSPQVVIPVSFPGGMTEKFMMQWRCWSDRTHIFPHPLFSFLRLFVPFIVA